ncbi:prephenate dehydratase [Marinicrinis lubricantis]|uniref:Prephenate dehydratase n=1 Tax=Marinicrinis lubricantis TaxID=2086470 RepID=A0ABW1ITP4_9BACL
MKKIAFLGPEGTVSEESARFFFEGQPVEFVPYKLITDVFSATAKGETDASVIPIENTIDGSVSLHHDLLIHEYDLPITAEWVYPSIQNLIGLPGAELSSIRKVFSHPVAIGQCREFIGSNLPHAELEPVSSTAEGVYLVKQQQRQDTAAIGTLLAAAKYGLQVLKPTVQDHKNNYTRFILVGSRFSRMEGSSREKTSILVTLPEDYPGALHQVLSAFAWRKINLSRIESRPTKKKLGSYYFFIDIQERLDTVLLQAAIEEIQAIGCQIRILGSYSSYSYEHKKENSEV